MSSHSLNPQPISPTAMSIAAAAQVLSKMGGRLITEAMLRADIDAGAPLNPDGTLNLVAYGAWLVKDMGRSGD